MVYLISISIIENFNEDIYKDNISLKPCAYLRNYKEENRSNIDNELLYTNVYGIRCRYH